MRDLTGPESPPTAIARCSLTGRIFVGCDDGSLLLYDAAEVADVAASPVLIGRHVSADSHRVVQIVLYEDGRYLASGGGSNVIVWDLAGRRPIQLQRDGRLLSGAAFIHPGILVTGTTEGELLLWCTATGRLLRRLAAHTAPILSLAASPAGDSLAATAEDGIVHIWDVATGIRRWSDTISCMASAQMAFTTDGGTLAISPSRNVGDLLIYNAETGSRVTDLKPCRTGINALVCAEDGSWVFCDNEGTLWNQDAAGTERRWSFGSFLSFVAGCSAERPMNRFVVERVSSNRPTSQPAKLAQFLIAIDNLPAFSPIAPVPQQYVRALKLPQLPHDKP